MRVIVNTPTLETMIALNLIKKLNTRNLINLLIIPDIPECLNEMGNEKGIKSLIVRLLNRWEHKLVKVFQKFVFLTDAMNDYYRVSNNDYIVMEGLLDPDKMYRAIESKQTEPNIKSKNKEIILYTGTLKRIFGITDLIDIFNKANFENCELWICGSGETESYIRQCEESNSNIHFFGNVSPEEALYLQSQATILVNPRSADGNYTRYSFPSKTIEYLLSGKTVIMNRLPGIPSEYDNFIFYPTDKSHDSWIEKLQEIMKMDAMQRNKIANLGRDFILTQKNSQIQCKRIINLLNN